MWSEEWTSLHLPAQSPSTVVIQQQPQPTVVVQRDYNRDYGIGALILAIVVTIFFLSCGCWWSLICSIIAIIFAVSVSYSIVFMHNVELIYHADTVGTTCVYNAVAWWWHDADIIHLIHNWSPPSFQPFRYSHLSTKITTSKLSQITPIHISQSSIVCCCQSVLLLSYWRVCVCGYRKCQGQVFRNSWVSNATSQ